MTPANASRIPAYAVLIAVAFVLSKYLSWGEPVQVLGRPLTVVIVLVVVVQVVTSIGTRSRHLGAYFAALALLALVDHALAWLVLLAAAGPLVIGLLRSRRVIRLDWSRLTAFLNAIAVVALVTTVASTVNAGALNAVGVPNEPRGVAPAAPDAPDIYLLLLDGYPRADTLTRDFAFDNDPFLDAMRDLGFEVAEDAHSNYNLTALTLGSVFNVKHIGELMPQPPSAPEAQIRAITKVINDGAALREVRRLGYSVIGLPSNFAGLALLGAAR